MSINKFHFNNTGIGGILKGYWQAVFQVVVKLKENADIAVFVINITLNFFVINDICVL